MVSRNWFMQGEPGCTAVAAMWRADSNIMSAGRRNTFFSLRSSIRAPNAVFRQFISAHSSGAGPPKRKGRLLGLLYRLGCGRLGNGKSRSEDRL